MLQARSSPSAATPEPAAAAVDLLVGLQLTHSGRFCRPHSKRLEPRIAYHHPLLDEKFGIDPDDDFVVWTDDDRTTVWGRFSYPRLRERPEVESAPRMNEFEVLGALPGEPYATLQHTVDTLELL